MNRLNFSAAVRVTRKDIRILLRERGTLLYLFAVPILFILAFGATTGIGSDPKEEAITLPVVNLDLGSDASQTLIDVLNQDGGIQCETYDAAQAQHQLDREIIERLLTIPANYSENLQAGHSVTLHLVNGPDANPAKTEAVQRVLAGVAADLSLKTQLIASFRQMSDMQAAAASEQQVFTEEIIIEQAQTQFERAKTEPLLGLEESWPQYQGENVLGTNPLNVYVTCFAVLFIFLTAQTTAQSIYEEKKVGSFRRLLAAPVSKVMILVGKMIPNFIIGFAQIVVLFSAGVLVFPVLGLDPISLGEDPLALTLVCLVLLLCSASLGVLIASIARTEGQISGLSAVVLWAFGFAGFLFVQIPSTGLFDTIIKVIPHYWANTAFLDLFIHGGGLADIATSIWVLLGFTALFFTAGLWRFDFN